MLYFYTQTIKEKLSSLFINPLPCAVQLLIPVLSASVVVTVARLSHPFDVIHLAVVYG
jgi:hypothetical protein